jgi:hypothetical protein
MEISPACFRLVRHKNHSVALALQGRRWMRGLQRIQTEDRLRQFIELWSQLQGIQLQENEDTISWRFEPSGQYSARSAYNVQFIGAFPDQNWSKIWKLKVEPKCRFFVWLLLQSKLPTADRIIKRGGQADPICKLCYRRQEKLICT